MTEKLRASERAGDRIEQEKVQLEKCLGEVAAEADTNERAWEYSQAQKDYEVCRLHSMVTHASNQNKQLRWNEEAQTQEALKWAEQAMAFNGEAGRLTQFQNHSTRERETTRQEARHVFDKAKGERDKYEVETMQLREYPTKVLAAGRAFEGQHLSQMQEMAEYKTSLVGCKDCKKYKGVAEKLLSMLVLSQRS